MAETTLEQRMLNEYHDRLRRDEFPKMHPKMAKAIRMELAGIFALILPEVRRWRQAYPKNTPNAKVYYESGAIFEAIEGMQPDAEKWMSVMRLVELEIAGLEEKLMQLSPATRSTCANRRRESRLPLAKNRAKLDIRIRDY
jgi:hypothetical protein